MVERLDAVARRTGQTRHSCLVEAITTFLDDREDYFLAQDSWEDFEASTDTAVTLDEIKWGSGHR